MFDTLLEYMPSQSIENRPWERGINSEAAVHEWFESNPEFQIDKHLDNKFLISVAPDGCLNRIFRSAVDFDIKRLLLS